MNPRGSYMEATLDLMPRCVGGWFLTLLMNVKQSVSIFQCIPSVLSVWMPLKARSFVFVSITCSDAGILCITAVLLDINLCRRGPPFAHISHASLASFMAHSTDSTLVTPSST